MTELRIDAPNEKQRRFFSTGTGTSPTAGPEAVGRAGRYARRQSFWRCGTRGSSF